jgi:hypothetical protein
MSSSLTKFNLELEKAVDKIHGDFNKFYKSVCLEVLKRIVMRTPVDTGRARGNWQLEINRTASASLIVEGSKEAMTDFALNSGLSKLAGVIPFSVVHITNNLEYIYYLEYDRRSSQHPEGMVEITITEMNNWVSNIK